MRKERAVGALSEVGKACGRCVFCLERHGSPFIEGRRSTMHCGLLDRLGTYGIHRKAERGVPLLRIGGRHYAYRRRRDLIGDQTDTPCGSRRSWPIYFKPEFSRSPRAFLRSVLLVRSGRRRGIGRGK